MMPSLLMRNSSLQGSRAPLAGQLYDEGLVNPPCSPCTGYYQLRGGGRGGATFVLLKLMGPPIAPQAARRHTREEEETPWGASTFNYTSPWLPEHLQPLLAPSTIAPSTILLQPFRLQLFRLQLLHLQLLHLQLFCLQLFRLKLLHLQLFHLQLLHLQL